MNADYGDLFDEYFRDPVTLQVKPFTPTAGVLPVAVETSREHIVPST